MNYPLDSWLTRGTAFPAVKFIDSPPCLGVIQPAPINSGSGDGSGLGAFSGHIESNIDLPSRY